MSPIAPTQFSQKPVLQSGFNEQIAKLLSKLDGIEATTLASQTLKKTLQDELKSSKKFNKEHVEIEIQLLSLHQQLVALKEEPTETTDIDSFNAKLAMLFEQINDIRGHLTQRDKDVLQEVIKLKQNQTSKKILRQKSSWQKMKENDEKIERERRSIETERKAIAEERFKISQEREELKRFQEMRQGLEQKLEENGKKTYLIDQRMAEIDQKIKETEPLMQLFQDMEQTRQEMDANNSKIKEIDQKLAEIAAKKENLEKERKMAIQDYLDKQ